jgi:hypothetical protein
MGWFLAVLGSGREDDTPDSARAYRGTTSLAAVQGLGRDRSFGRL